jgi:hypothetical protein
MKWLAPILYLLPLLIAEGAFANDPSRVVVDCPKTWPGDPSARLSRAFFWVDDQAPSATPDTTIQGNKYTEVYGGLKADLQCVYGNHKTLIIPVPGDAPECTDVYTAVRRPPQPEVVTPISATCTFPPSGNSARDKVEIFAVEPLAADTPFYGVRLGMSPAEIRVALGSHRPGAEGAAFPVVVGDGNHLSVTYDASGLKAVRIVVDPPVGVQCSLMPVVKRRFGLPPTNAMGNPSKFKWKGDDGTVLEVLSCLRGQAEQIRLFAFDGD